MTNIDPMFGVTNPQYQMPYSFPMDSMGINTFDSGIQIPQNFDIGLALNGSMQNMNLGMNTNLGLNMTGLNMPSYMGTPNIGAAQTGMFPQLNFQLPQLQLPQFQMPQFSFNFQNPFTNSGKTDNVDKTNNASTKKPVKKEDGSDWAPTGKKDLAYWKSQGYDEEMGKKLALDAYKRCPFVWNGQCVGYTRKTINAIYGTNFKNAGAGYNFGHKILDSSELKGKFKCFKINGIKKEDIPDGAILIWPSSAFGKGKAAQYGHGAIAYKGDPYSDNKGCNTMKCNEIWIPVKA